MADVPDPGAARSRQRGGIRARWSEIWRKFRHGENHRRVPALDELEMIPDDDEEQP